MAPSLFYTTPSQKHGGAAFTPTTPSGLILWLDGADPAGTGTPPAGGTGITSFVDKSTSGFNFSSLTGAPTYQTNQNLGKGAVKTSGSQFFTLAQQMISSASPFTIAMSFYPIAGSYPNILNVQTNSTTGLEFFWGTGYNFITTGAHVIWAPIAWTGSGTSYSAWNYFILTYNGSGAGTAGNFTGYLNSGTVTATATTVIIGGNTPNNNYIFTDNAGDPTPNGTMVQNICIYNNVLSGTNIANLYTYLSTVGG